MFLQPKIPMGMGTKENRTLIILHIAVLLAGWTGIFGRLISLGGLPLVWYRMMVSAALLFGEYREVGFSFWLGIVLIVLSVLIQSRRILRRES